jgi:hypothetical protein
MEISMPQTVQRDRSRNQEVMMMDLMVMHGFHHGGFENRIIADFLHHRLFAPERDEKH